MALTIKDAHSIVNTLVKELTGGNSTIQAVDTSSFVSAGELLLNQAGIDKVMNALSLIIGRTLIASRPYEPKFDNLNRIDSGLLSGRVRKISYYSRPALASGAFNTDLFTNEADGFTAGQNPDANGTAQSTKSQFEQVQAIPVEMNFYSSNTWQVGLSRYDWQVQEAFTSEESFLSFIDGCMQEVLNDIASQKEAFARMAVLNHIAGVYDESSVMPGSAVDLVAAFNSEYGTSYTGTDLRTTYKKEFLAFFVKTFKLTSDLMTYRTSNYHATPVRNDASGNPLTLLRHTPKDRQKAILYNPFFVDAETSVLPEIFNDEYLKVENGARVDFWQNFNQPSKIDITPCVTHFGTGQAVQGSRVQLPYVLGCIMDEDALWLDFKLDTARVSPPEARKGYRTTWWTFLKGVCDDFTENTVIFYMAS